MMKNSEWGAVAYLAQSKYVLNGTNIYIYIYIYNRANIDTASTAIAMITMGFT